ncbi:nitroreductase/quinone reductase family protein, partial [Mycobacterium sp. ZZG]
KGVWTDSWPPTGTFVSAGGQFLLAATGHFHVRRWAVFHVRRQYHNLKAHPECEFGQEPFTAHQVTDPEEHRRLYGLAEQVYAGYADYREKTADSGRQIPIFRLTPR